MFDELRNTILCGDALEMLKSLPDGCVQTVCTSPPYYGLRDYSTEEIVFSRTDLRDCLHEWVALPKESQFKAYCSLCDAFKKDQQIGMEETPREYIDKLVQVFREVRRVLRSDGTCWANLGDSFFAHNGTRGNVSDAAPDNKNPKAITHMHRINTDSGFKSKDLMMMPARVAIALQEDGWYLRQDCIWHKTNAMPESVTDRPTTAHEHVFLLAKSSSYFYDAEAIKEPLQASTLERGYAYSDTEYVNAKSQNAPSDVRAKDNWHGKRYVPNGRNKRSVWPIPTQSFPEAHFATFPEKLVEPMILAGSSPRACEQCNAPWERVTVSTGHVNKREVAHAPFSTPTKTDSTGWAPTSIATNQWQPTCACPDSKGSGKCIVLDPFMGSGTTALVALQQGREYLGIELNPDYIRLIEQRLSVIQPTLWIA